MNIFENKPASEHVSEPASEQTYKPQNQLEAIYDAFPDQDWDTRDFIYNPNLYFSFLKKIPPNKIKKNIHTYIENDNFELSKENINFFRKQGISIKSQHLVGSVYLTVDDINNNLLFNLNMDIFSLFCRFDVYLNFPQFQWNYSKLSQNRHITMDIIEENKHLPWDYSVLHINRNLTLKFFEDNINKNWNYAKLSGKKIITLNIIKKYPDIPWSYLHFSQNVNVSWELVCSNQDIAWDYNGLSSNPNITWDIMMANKNIKWNFEEYQKNPSLTVDVIKKAYLADWDFSIISVNYFTFDLNYYWLLIKKYINQNYFIIPDISKIIIEYA
jgi:hypothetical protein